MRERTSYVRENGFSDLVLVCANDRDSHYACCADAHGPAVYDAVSTWLRDRGLFWSHVYVAETSCLGLCSEDGAAIAIQPRDRWYSDVRPEDVPDLLVAAFGADASKLGQVPATLRGRTPSKDTE